MSKLVFRTNNSGYIGNRPPAPRTNAADDGGWVSWEQRNSLSLAPRVNAAGDDEWFDYETGKPVLRANAVDDGGWVSWENRNTGAAPTVNNDSEWSDYVKPEVK